MRTVHFTQKDEFYQVLLNLNLDAYVYQDILPVLDKLNSPRGSRIEIDQLLDTTKVTLVFDTYHVDDYTKVEFTGNGQVSIRHYLREVPQRLVIFNVNHDKLVMSTHFNLPTHTV